MKNYCNQQQMIFFPKLWQFFNIKIQLSVKFLKLVSPFSVTIPLFQLVIEEYIYTELLRLIKILVSDRTTELLHEKFTQGTYSHLKKFQCQCNHKSLLISKCFMLGPLKHNWDLSITENVLIVHM